MGSYQRLPFAPSRWGTFISTSVRLVSAIGEMLYAEWKNGVRNLTGQMDAYVE